jgi:site-specific DNA recombinase
MIAAIYARKSTDQSGVSDEQRSVARQVEHARAYAARKGWRVADEHVYVDDGISGAEFANRPGFLRLMNALKPQAPFQALVMSEESRLGREAIETAYALKQLVQAGVRVFFYLEDRERTLDSPTDKIMLSLTAFADELEREKARQRTYDAMQRKARAGHVTGGACFGYRNVDVLGVGGTRSHVTRQIDEEQAAIIRRIFDLCAAGHGVKAIAKILNAAGAPSPRAQRGRSNTWAPTSVREVLFRSAYRGEIVWNQTRKRDSWGLKRQRARDEREWMRIPAPALRIISEDAWQAAHARLAAARALYLRGTSGQAFGRPSLGSPSPYLLTNLAACGCCGGPLKVRTRSHGRLRAKFYGCAGYHDRGRTVCTNQHDVPMSDADAIVLEALLDEVLTPDILREAVDGALDLVRTDARDGRREQLETELAKLERERDRMVAAIAAGGELDSLVAGVRERERRRATLMSEAQAIAAQRPARAANAATLRAELEALAADWRQVLADDAAHARPIVTQLLLGRVSFRPLETKGRWAMTGEGTLAGLFTREMFPSVWRPRRDSNPCFSLERAASWASGRRGQTSVEGITERL